MQKHDTPADREPTPDDVDPVLVEAVRMLLGWGREALERRRAAAAEVAAEMAAAEQAPEGDQ